MKSPCIGNCPETTPSQSYLLSQITKIKTMDTHITVKIELMSSLLSLLKCKEQTQKIKAQQNISTSFSEDLSNFTIYEHQIDQLEDRILEKRAIKFQINQEIQAVEEDLYQMEKTVDTKRDYDEQLRKQLQRKMKAIQHIEQHSQHHSVQQKPHDRSYLDKSFKAVSGIFKGWLY